MKILPLALACVACACELGSPNESDQARDLALHPFSNGANAWVGTWAVSPQSDSTTFNQQTLRQIVHTSIGGDVARVQISNAFGTQPLSIADVHIAQRASGSSITLGSDQKVTFGGQSTTSIPVGGVAVSDSIAFPVAALSDVAISVYLPQSTGPATYHQQGTQTNYIASGDVSANQNLTGAQTTGSYYFLVNLDVQNPAAQGAVVTLGASITDGNASAQDANHRWPNFLATRLANAGLTVGVLNQGISGNRLLADGAGQSALNRFERDVLSQPGVKWVIFSDDPINDLGSTNPTPTSQLLIDGLTKLISAAHAKGIKFICSTLTPFKGAGYWTQNGETGREGVDAFILGPNSGCDGVVDQDLATHDPATPTQFLPADDSGDHLHPSDMGRQAIANAVDLGLFASDASPGDDAGADDAGRDAGGGVHDAAAPGDSAAPVADSGGSRFDAGDSSSAAEDSGAQGSGCNMVAAIPTHPRGPSVLLALGVVCAALLRRRGRQHER